MTGEIRPLSPTRAVRVLKSSVAHALLNQETTRERETGTLVDALLLGRVPETVAVPFDNYRTKEAQRLRDEARAAGKIPLLNGEENELAVVAEKAGPILKSFGYDVTHKRIEWVADGCPHRGELDAFRTSALVIGDVKTCGSGEAVDAASGSRIRAMGYDIQLMAYVEGIASTMQVDPDNVEVLMHFVEVEPPYGVVTVPFAPSLREMGRRRWARAREKWMSAYASGNFQPYEGRLVLPPAEAPSWAIQEEERIMFDAVKGKEPF